ncbi:molybdenum cofactor guanylyltransferase [Devosia lucknowensis]|uniref:Molybdenum cofactor guanylyltransferase n=1 Tax=Devosia lucknowensis TaxID=1096929 RepID=A0A1Y6ELW9_9HYPH|nr:molybdenum cofactor guanylyltransferase [Devosia lucknowensis]SMQ63644.1 molybdenum cofactor guanylyltransferase [Devosia lucknowensis]
MTVHALVLAGGQGSRLGQVRKDLIRFGGTSLLDRVIAQLPDFGTPIMVSTAAMGQLSRHDCVAMPDLDLPIGGPLAGLIAAVDRLGNADPDDLIITVAVDTPFLPDDFARRLIDAVGDRASAAHAAWCGTIYPTNAVWRLSGIADLPARARRGVVPKSPKALLGTLDSVEVDWSDTHREDPFANLNTLEDLVSLARRAQAQGK